VYADHAAGVLRRKPGQHRHAVPAERRERLEVGLDAGPAAGVGPGDREQIRDHGAAVRTEPRSGSVSTNATANDTSDADSHDGGVKCSRWARPDQKLAQPSTWPGLTNWYATKPASHGISRAYRGGASSASLQD